MKKKLKILCCAALIICVFALMATLASAEGIALHTSGLGKGDVASAKVSYGLDIMANEFNIQFAGISGSPLNFSEEKFACAMNLSEVSEIEVVSLPSADLGTLYFGSSAVVCGQKISKNSIGLMSYEANSSVKDEQSSFKVKINSSEYEIECQLFMLDKVNASPSLSGIPAISLNIETYRGVSAKGILCGYDPEGDEITYEIVSYPKNGFITMADKNSGEYVYTPMSDYTGQDGFTYVAKDRYGNYSASATVSVKVSTPHANVVYSDLIDSDCYNYALNMTEKNVMNGEKVGDYYYFRPDGEVSRIDFIVNAMKSLGIDNIPQVDTTVFTDDGDIGDEVKGYVALAYSKEYISGISENGKLYFKPEESIKLSEAAVILSNMIGYSEYHTTPTFANSDEIPAFSKQAVMSLRALGIIELPSDAAFENTTISRAEMAKLLTRATWVSNKT